MATTTIVYTKGPNGAYVARKKIKKREQAPATDKVTLTATATSDTKPFQSSALDRFVEDASNQLHFLGYKIKETASTNHPLQLSRDSHSRSDSITASIDTTTTTTSSDASDVTSIATDASDATAGSKKANIFVAEIPSPISESSEGESGLDPNPLIPSTPVSPAVVNTEPLPRSLYIFPSFRFKMPKQVETFAKFHAPSFVGGIALTIILHRMSPFLAVQAVIALNILKYLVLWVIVAGGASWYFGFIKPAHLAQAKQSASLLQRQYAPMTVKMYDLSAVPVVVVPTAVASAAVAPAAVAPAAVAPAAVAKEVPVVAAPAPVAVEDRDPLSKIPSAGLGKESDTHSLASIDTSSTKARLRSQSPRKVRNNTRITPWRSQQPTPTEPSFVPPALGKRASYDVRMQLQRPSVFSNRSYQSYQPVRNDPDQLPFINRVILNDEPETEMHSLAHSNVAKDLPEIPVRFAMDNMSGVGVSRLHSVQSKRSVLGTRANYNKFMSNVRDDE